MTAPDLPPSCAGCSSALCPDCNPNGAQMTHTPAQPATAPSSPAVLREAEYRFRIEFSPRGELYPLAVVLMAEYDERGRKLDELAAELAAVRAERDALRAGADAADLPVRLQSGAELVAATGAALTADALRAVAHRLEHLPAELLDALTRYVLHGPLHPDTAETEITR